MASAAAKTTPMAASVASPLACSSFQTMSVPTKSVAPPPTSGRGYRNPDNLMQILYFSCRP